MFEKDSTVLLSGVVALGSILVSHLRISQSKPEIYEDRDGTATKESLGKFSTKLPKTLLAVFTLAGLFVSMTLAVLGTLNDDGLFLENWISAAQWVRTCCKI